MFAELQKGEKCFAERHFCQIHTEACGLWFLTTVYERPELQCLRTRIQDKTKNVFFIHIKYIYTHMHSFSRSKPGQFASLNTCIAKECEIKPVFIFIYRVYNSISSLPECSSVMAGCVQSVDSSQHALSSAWLSAYRAVTGSPAAGPWLPGDCSGEFPWSCRIVSCSVLLCHCWVILEADEAAQAAGSCLFESVLARRLLTDRPNPFAGLNVFCFFFASPSDRGQGVIKSWFILKVLIQNSKV